MLFIIIPVLRFEPLHNALEDVKNGEKFSAR